MRCEQASFADLDIGTSSEPQVKHEIFFSVVVGFGGSKREKMLEPFLACSVAVFEEAVGTSTLERADVELRCMVDDGRSRTLVTLFCIGGRWDSEWAGGLELVSLCTQHDSVHSPSI